MKFIFNMFLWVNLIIAQNLHKTAVVRYYLEDFTSVAIKSSALLPVSSDCYYDEVVSEFVNKYVSFSSDKTLLERLLIVRIKYGIKNKS